jgi:molybdopterin-containing oxidoreductase family iron-sulfur binding subunit
MTSGLADGTLANVSWLQEFPDPVTKVCWDNYVSISPKDAAREGLREGDVVILTASGTKVEVPAHIQPGQADGVLGLAVGYGRTGMGRIADNVGVNAYPLAVFKKDQVVYAGLPATLTKAQKSVALANTQGHHSMEGRELVIEATLAEFQANPSAGIKKEKIKSMWSTYEYPNHKWGMVIDLNSCTGCSACVVACQAENNIPVVGKKYVLRRREMHWIRIDRYYAGAPENPKAVFQPITCQHCDNAPCETVCPVLATVHSDEGTNDMIYNRCVGTRYCSNNCPYKVRRFNWFNYVKTVAKPLHNQLNPEVTVRARGVMEKCTFCTHKIHQAKSRARIEQREMVDGDVKTACQLSCPADAITFGDLRDEKSAVSRLFESERSYSLLADLNTSPALHYLTKIRNSEGVKGQHS